MIERARSEPPIGSRHAQALEAPVYTAILCMAWALAELVWKGAVGVTWINAWYTAGGTAFAGMLVAPLATLVLMVVLAPAERFLARHARRARAAFLCGALIAYALLAYWIARFTGPRVGVRLPRGAYLVGLAVLGVGAIAIALRVSRGSRLRVRLHLALVLLVAYWFHVQSSFRGGAVHVLSGAAMYALLLAAVTVVVCRRPARPRRRLLMGLGLAILIVLVPGICFPWHWRTSFAARRVMVGGSYMGRNAVRVAHYALPRDGLQELAGRNVTLSPADLGPFADGGRELVRALAASGARNVLLVTVDTLRWDAFHADGLPTFRRLREEGVVFEEARSAAPLTRMSLRSLLHGDHAGGPGPTLTEILAGAGYATLQVTTWGELGRDPIISRGFQRIERSTHRWFNAPSGSDPVTEALLAGLAGETRPFFAWAHYLDPHAPYDAPGWADRTRYDGEVAKVDAALGRLFDALAADGRLDQTLVVVTADHGEEFGEHGGRWHGQTLYDEVLRVPLILRGPGGKIHGTVRAPVSGADVGPTVLGILRRARPEGYAPDGEDAAIAAPTRSQLSRIDDRQVAAVLGRWKLIAGLQYGAIELYDLAIDPGERVNLVDARPDVASFLSRELIGFAERVAPQGGRPSSPRTSSAQ